jgi:ParB-like chromosome segregation protein Spo0J
MEIRQIPLPDIRPADYNPRKIDQVTLDRLVANIREFGLVDPLIVNRDMTLVGGHQRLKALNALGWKEAPCVVLDLSKEKERLLNIALNKISGEFDKVQLKDLLLEIDQEGGNLALSGFEDLELEKLLLPPDPPEVKQWELGDVYEPFWIVVRGPISECHKVRRAIEESGAENLTVEGGL